MSAARHLHITPTAAEVLSDEISELAAQIDRRLANRPGTAERAIYFWLYPLDDELPCEVLSALHSDAVAYLHDLTTTAAVLITETTERTPHD